MRAAIFNVVDFTMYSMAWAVLKVSSLFLRALQKDSPDQRMNVLVFANQAIGDTIIKVPFFFALRKEFPKDKYRITVVLSPSMAPALSRMGCFDDVVAESVPPYRHAFFWVFGRLGFAAKSLRWALRNKVEVFFACDRYRDLGVDFARSLCRPASSMAYDTSMVSSLFPVSARIQKLVYDKGYSLLQKPSSGRHQIEDVFSFLSFAVGRKIAPAMVDAAKLAPMVDLSVSEKYGLTGGEYLVLVPGAAAVYRRWPAERFAEIAKIVGGKIVVVGSKEESGLAVEISAKSGLPVSDLCGKTDICQLLGVISRAKIVVSNETGAANCAAILGVKTVCILGGGDFGSFFPNKFCANSVSVFHMDDCFSCAWKCKDSSFNAQSCAPCIDRISADEVAHAIRVITDSRRFSHE